MVAVVGHRWRYLEGGGCSVRFGLGAVVKNGTRGSALQNDIYDMRNE